MDLKNEVSKKEKVKEENEALRKLLVSALTQHVPNPRAYICHHFMTEANPNLEASLLTEQHAVVVAESPAVAESPDLVELPARQQTNNPEMISIETQTWDRIVITPAEHENLLQCKEIYENIKKHLSKKRYVGTDLSQDVLATAFAFAPGCSSAARETIISAGVYTFLNDIGWKEPNLAKKVSLSCTPSQSATEHFVSRAAAKRMVVLKKELENKNIKIYIACDKGNKKGISHFVKYITYWCRKRNRVKKVLLDCDASAGTSEACAEAVSHSMNKIDPLPPKKKRKLYGQCTDAGGGGTGESMARELTKVKRRIRRRFMSSTCALHAHNLTLKNPVSTLFGEGGLSE